jgi:putative ABC transport system substrate-binding protein
MENKIPVIAFSSKYVEMGAFMSIDIDPYRAGQQAGAMANHLLMGDTCDFEPDAIGCLVTINSKVARKLNLNVGGEIANVRYVR